MKTASWVLLLFLSAPACLSAAEPIEVPLDKVVEALVSDLGAEGYEARERATEALRGLVRETRLSPWHADSTCLLQPLSPRARSASMATNCTREAVLFLARNSRATRRAALASPLSSRCSDQSATTGAKSGAACRAKSKSFPAPALSPARTRTRAEASSKAGGGFVAAQASPTSTCCLAVSRSPAASRQGQDM